MPCATVTTTSLASGPQSAVRASRVIGNGIDGAWGLVPGGRLERAVRAEITAALAHYVMARQASREHAAGANPARA